MWRSRLEFTEECNRRDPRDFANEGRYTCRVPAGTAYGDEDSVDLLGLQIVDHVVNALPMQCPIAPFASSICT
jgi:hypothetical protein